MKLPINKLQDFSLQMQLVMSKLADNLCVSVLTLLSCVRQCLWSVLMRILDLGASWESPFSVIHFYKHAEITDIHDIVFGFYVCPRTPSSCHKATNNNLILFADLSPPLPQSIFYLLWDSLINYFLIKWIFYYEYYKINIKYAHSSLADKF